MDGVRADMPQRVTKNALGRWLLMSAVVAMSSHSQAQAPQVYAALQSLQTGLWEFRSRNEPALNRSICLSDASAMLQLRHFGQNCQRFIISNTNAQTTVQYSCTKADHGQTSVRVETPRLVQLESQGVAGRAPFAFSMEGRRIGQCGQPTAVRRR